MKKLCAFLLVALLSLPLAAFATASAEAEPVTIRFFSKLNRYNPQSLLQKSGHGSIVETSYGEIYMAHHCGRPFLPELRCTLGRESCLQRMEWNADGWLRLMDGGNTAKAEVPSSLLAQGVPAPHTITQGWTKQLHELYTPRISASGFTSMNERPGWLRMRGQESLSSLNRASLLCHKLTSLHAQAVVTLEIEPEYYQAYAGIMIYYDNMDYILLRKAYSQTLQRPVLDLLRVENGERSYPLQEDVPLQGGSITLKVSVQEREVRFFWGYAIDSLQAIGPAFDTSHFSDEYCKHGEFTGTFLGIGCVDALFHRVYADVSFFEYRETVKEYH